MTKAKTKSGLSPAQETCLLTIARLGPACICSFRCRRDMADCLARRGLLSLAERGPDEPWRATYARARLTNAGEALARELLAGRG